MAYAISDKCTSCGICEGLCPALCITEEDGKYQIDVSACLDCGICEAVCPVDAIIKM